MSSDDWLLSHEREPRWIFLYQRASEIQQYMRSWAAQHLIFGDLGPLSYSSQVEKSMATSSVYGRTLISCGGSSDA